MNRMCFPVSDIAKYALENPSSIREIMSVVTDFREHPEKYPRKLIYLGGGWPQDPPPKALIEATREIIDDASLFNEYARYGTTRGQTSFIRSIVKYEREIFARNVSFDEILVGSGSTELIGATIIACVNLGDEVIVTRLAYLNYIRQLQVELKLNVKIKAWNLINDYEFNPSLDELYSLISNKTKLMILTSPGNPDSRVISNEILNGIVDFAEDKDFIVMIDVAYRAFLYDSPPKYISRSRRENEIWMCTLSKEMRVPGWRLAYLIADPTLIRVIEVIEQARTLCPNRFVQEVMTRVFSDNRRLREVKNYYEKQRKLYAEVARYMYEQLSSRIDGLRVLRPEAGFYVFFNHEEYEPISKRVCNELLSKWQVALAPGVDFLMDGWTRLSLLHAF